MRKRAPRPLLKVTLNVFKEDWEKLAQYHRRLGPSVVTRELIRDHVAKIEEKMAQTVLPDLDKLVG
jgi:hypothetical protein